MFFYRFLHGDRNIIYQRLIKILELFIITNAFMLFFSGIFLSMWYQPSPERAYQSVYFIKNCIYFGDFLLSLHRLSTHIFIAAMIIHMLVTLPHGSRKQWISGIFLLYTAILFLYTGYLLRWDFEGYHSVKAAALIVGDVPLVGETIKNIILSGDDITYLTLSRFYFYHIFILPLLFFALINVHIKTTYKNAAVKDDLGIIFAFIGFIIFSSVLYKYNLGDEIAEGQGKVAPPWMFLWAYTIDYTLGNISPELNFFTGTIIVFLAIYFVFVPYLKKIFGERAVIITLYVIFIVLSILSLYSFLFLI